MKTDRIVCWFSCGAASAFASKLAIEKYGHNNLDVVYCDLSKNEDEDNIRFRKDCELWLDHPITLIRNPEFSRIEEVFDKRKYVSGPKWAPCTVAMKKIPRFDYQRADDLNIFGMTFDEQERIAGFVKGNPELNLEWILVAHSVTKPDCFKALNDAGIALPVRYKQGFRNNNCKCCVKATSLAYWVLSRRVNPAEFASRAEQSRRIGCRLTRWKGKRIFLDEIPPDDQIPERFLRVELQENVSCGPECGQI